MENCTVWSRPMCCVQLPEGDWNWFAISSVIAENVLAGIWEGCSCYRFFVQKFPLQPSNLSSCGLLQPKIPYVTRIAFVRTWVHQCLALTNLTWSLSPGAPMGQRAPYSISQPGAVVPAPLRMQKCWSQLSPVRNLHSHPDFWSFLAATLGASLFVSPWGMWDGALEGETSVLLFTFSCFVFRSLSLNEQTAIVLLIFSLMLINHNIDWIFLAVIAA